MGDFVLLMAEKALKIADRGSPVMNAFPMTHRHSAATFAIERYPINDISHKSGSL
jgi:hypothetical protein